MDKPIRYRKRKNERYNAADTEVDVDIPNLDTIGKHIRKYRIGKKLRQEDLAEKTGLSSNYIGMLERGEKIPALETFIRILNALEVSADLVLVDVLKTGYTVKNSLLHEKIEQLSTDDREMVYAVIETLLNYKK